MSFLSSRVTSSISFQDVSAKPLVKSAWCSLGSALAPGRVLGWFSTPLSASLNISSTLITCPGQVHTGRCLVFIFSILAAKTFISF